jgi:hypothetical protein
MINEQATLHSAPKEKGGDARFGIRVPKDGSRVPFRVLISVRWLWMAGTALIALLALGMQMPRRLRWPGIASAGLTSIAALVQAVMQARTLVLERVTIPMTDVPQPLDGFTIVQLSDFHLGTPFSVAHLRQAIRWVHQRQPNLVVLTGDFVNDTREIPLLRECLSGLTARYGVYAILGNHDYWTDILAVEQALAQQGITLLRNERRRIEVAGTHLYLVGIDCVWEAQHDLELALDTIPTGATVVVLAHEPDIADEVAPYGVSLQLSGHTHAGHIALPWLGPLFLPRHGFRYVRGLQRVGGMWLYVSRGLGGLPFRLGCPPEVTELTLRATPANGSDLSS